MNRKVSYAVQLDQLFEVFFQELQDLSDNEALEGESASSVKERAIARIQRATIEAGRRRLITARRARDVSRLSNRQDSISVSVSEARAYVVRAANDARITLAARNLDEMTDDDAIRLYCQILELESEDSDKAE